MTPKWVVCHIKVMHESYYTWMGHIIREWAVSRMNKSCLISSILLLFLQKMVIQKILVSLFFKKKAWWMQADMQLCVLEETKMKRTKKKTAVAPLFCWNSRNAGMVWMSLWRTNESCHIWIGHVAHEWVVSYMNESCHIWISYVTYECIVSYMNDSRNVWMSHVACEWVMSQRRESCHTLMNSVTHQWFTSLINGSCHS